MKTIPLPLFLGLERVQNKFCAVFCFPLIQKIVFKKCPDWICLNPPIPLKGRQLCYSWL